MILPFRDRRREAMARHPSATPPLWKQPQRCEVCGDLCCDPAPFYPSGVYVHVDQLAEDHTARPEPSSV